MVPAAQDLPRKDRGWREIGAEIGSAISPPAWNSVVLRPIPSCCRAGYSRPLLVSATAAGRATAALDGRSETSTRYAWSGPSHTSGSSACRTTQALYARASRSEDIAHAVIMRGSAVAMSNRRDSPHTNTTPAISAGISNPSATKPGPVVDGNSGKIPVAGFSATSPLNTNR